MSKIFKNTAYRFMIGISLATVVFFTLLITVVYQMSARSYSLQRLHECNAKITYDYESSKRDIRSFPPFSFLFDRDDWAPVWEISIKNYDSELDLAVLSCFRELEELQLYGMTDADLHRMPTLPRVRVATIDCRQLTEHGFAALDALENVELIIFNGSPISEQGFRGVAEMPRLEGIGFWGNKLSCIRHFGRQDNLVAVSIRDPIADLPSISLPEHLNIGSLIISATDLDISLLEGLLIPALVELELDSHDGWQFRTDRPYSRLEGLEQFPRLKSLRVLGFSISEQWLRTYVGRNAVEQLELSHCDLDPSFFSALSGWQSLVHLDLYRVKIQPVAVASCPPRLETFKLTNSEVGSLNFLNDVSFDILRERIVEHNTDFGSGQEINFVQENPMNSVDSKD